MNLLQLTPTALDVGPFKHKVEARGGKEKGEGGEEGKRRVWKKEGESEEKVNAVDF